MAVVGSKNSKKSPRTGRHRKATPKQYPVSQWLRVGAVGLGLGAAVTVGQGTANAAPDGSPHGGAHANRSGQGAHHSEKTSRSSGTIHAVKLPLPAAAAPTALLRATSQSHSVTAAPVRTVAKPSRAAFGDVASGAFAALSSAVREVELSASRRGTTSPSAITVLDTGESRQAAVGSDRRHPAMAASARPALTETDQEGYVAEFNKSLGWIPVAGTVVNALAFVSDFLAFTIAALSADVPDIIHEVADMATDVVGMIPIVGGPLAATIYHLRVGAYPVNHAPVVDDISATFTGIDAPTGKVTGLVNVVDPDGDRLTYTIRQRTRTAHVGTATITTSATGTFTFTPTTQARFDAWTTPGEAGATFTVNASDGQYSTLITVTAPISPIRRIPGRCSYQYRPWRPRQSRTGGRTGRTFLLHDLPVR